MKALIISIILIFCGTGFSQNVKLRIHGLTKGEGLIRIALYEDEYDYKKEISDLKYTFSKENVIYGLLEINLDIPPGSYVIAFLDDENKDAKMNYNILGIPKEGYAFSRIKDYGYSKPSFQESEVEITGESNQIIKVYFNYF